MTQQDKTTQQLITRCLKEDAAFKDITTHLLVSPKSHCRAVILTKEDATVCGQEIAQQVFQTIDRNVRYKILIKDGQTVKKNAKLALIQAKTSSLLKGERLALNFLGHLSGIATNTNAFVNAVKPTRCQILDTRKTTPGLRELEKYAVVCGGGKNHRMNLEEAVMIKDNHRMLYRENDLVSAIQKIRTKTSKQLIVEVDTLKEFQSILNTKPDIILLDNMSLAQMKKAVQMNQQHNKRAKILLEASGGITLKSVKKVAQAGVDRISIGALTHHCQSINFSLEILP